MSDLYADSYFVSSSPRPSDGSSNAQRAASAPVSQLSDQPALKQQISAPCYFHSLKENEAPPFRHPAPSPLLRLVIGRIVNQEDVVAMIAAADADEADGLRKCLSDLLIRKKVIRNFNLSEKNFLISFLTETIDYAAQRDYSSFKLSVLLTIYLKCHLYFKGYYWLPPASLWAYFKELMIRHTVEDSPDAQVVFEPEECYDILSHFHTLYMSNLPLVHILTFGACRLKLTWPYTSKNK